MDGVLVLTNFPRCWEIWREITLKRLQVSWNSTPNVKKDFTSDAIKTFVWCRLSNTKLI